MYQLTIGIDNDFLLEHFQHFVLQKIVYNTKIQIEEYINDWYEITIVVKNRESIQIIKELIQEEEIWIQEN